MNSKSALHFARIVTIGLCCIIVAGPVTSAKAQVDRSPRWHAAAALGTQATSASEQNLFGESVERVNRSLSFALAQLTYDHTNRLSFWVRYVTDQSPHDNALAGIDRLQDGFFFGTETNFGNYSARFQYGYQQIDNGVHQDIFATDQSYRLTNGLIPAARLQLGVSNDERLEWIFRAGVRIPISQSLGLEPLIWLTEHGFEDHLNTYLGMNTHISFMEKGRLRFALSRILNQRTEATGRGLLAVAEIPFQLRHHIKVTFQRNTFHEVQHTRFGIGLSIGFY